LKDVQAGDTVLWNGMSKPVVEATGEYIVVDTNHEMAGKTLTFEIELVAIETAS
jgi:FKBP-type peptidyl-prolyl cis-trans isomerase 2